MKKKFGLSLTLIICLFTANVNAQNNKSIQVWKKNPSYWQLNGKPVLLLGASNDDNLFQEKDCLDQLDELAAVGGNYVRNTMSDRDSGDLKAFAQNADGKYDLSKWNEEYWHNFERMLKHASKHGIIVQIEVWDRFDHTDSCPYNRAGNKRLTLSATHHSAIKRPISVLMSINQNNSCCVANLIPPYLHPERWLALSKWHRQCQSI